MALHNATLIGVTEVTPTTPSNIGGTIPYAATDASTNVNGILNDYKWSFGNQPLNLTYSFPSNSFGYTTAEGYGLSSPPLSGFEALSPGEQDYVVNVVFRSISSFTNLTFTQIPDTPIAHAALRLAASSVLPPGLEGTGRPPQPILWDAGDVWVSSGGETPLIGSTRVFLHEIGHALGLNHGEVDPLPGTNINQPASPFNLVDRELDDSEFSVMNYPGTGGEPQSYMMLDIAALQYYYGANFGNVGKNLTWRWDSVGGQEFIMDGSSVSTPGKPVADQAGNGKIFETVWTGGANSTYDLSNFTGDYQSLDMRPGHFMRFSESQIEAPGNVYNALLFNGDLRSEIDNIITGDGSVDVIGNDVFNIIKLGNGGTTSSGRGNTVEIGGAGALVNGGIGDDKVVASLAASTIHGGGGRNELDYSSIKDPIIVDLKSVNGAVGGTVSKFTNVGTITDVFTDIQIFDGGSGGALFKGLPSGGFSFNGARGVNNTLDYSSDTSTFDSFTFNVGSGTVNKHWLDAPRPSPNRAPIAVHDTQDGYSNVQSFIGGSGNNVFISAQGGFSFDGGGGKGTLDYSWDPGSLTIDLSHGTVDKGWTRAGFFHLPDWQGLDAFTKVGSFIGGSGNDGIVDAPGLAHSFDGGGGINTAVFDHRHTDYAITSAVRSDGLFHTTVTDNNLAGLPSDGQLDLVHVQWLRFADGLFPVLPPMHWWQQQTVSASSLLTGLGINTDGLATTEYALWNTGGDGGHFILDGAAQGTNQEIDVTAAQLGNLTYEPGSGGDTLWVRTYDGTQWSLWSSPLTTLDNAPVVTGSNVQAAHGQSFAASSLFSVSDADGDTITKYAFWNNGTGGGHFVLNGVAQGTSQEIDVSASQLSQLSYQSGSGADTLWVKANDGILWSGWSNSFTVTAPEDKLPVVTASNKQAAHGQSFTASSLFSVTDGDGDTITKYAFWNSGTGGGHFVLNGVAQGTSQEIDVSASQLSQLSYQSGSGADTLWVQANDGILWSGWSNSFTVTAPEDKGPTVTPINVSLKSLPNQTFTASSLISYSDDPFKSQATQYDFWNSGAGGGHFLLNGNVLRAGQDNIISAAQLGQLSYVVGNGSDTLWARANDGTVWGGWSQPFTISDPPAVGGGETITLGSAYSGQVDFLSNTGTLKLEDSASFTGTVAGLCGEDTIDLADIGFGESSTLGYSANADNSGGSLSVGDGTHMANIALLASYMASSFVAASDGHGGTLVSETAQSATQVPMVTQPHA